MLSVYRSMVPAIALFSLLLIGCGSGNLATHPVEGKVEFKGGGHPKFGTIEFYCEQKKLNARGKINDDGTFTVGTYGDGDGAVEGEHQVVINQIVTNHLSASAKVEIDHDHGKTAAPKYRDYKTSGLKCTIKPGTNTVEFKIESGK